MCAQKQHITRKFGDITPAVTESEEINSSSRPSTSKSLVRNCEVIHSNKSSEDVITSSTIQTKNEKEKTSSSKLSEPKPNSCIKIADYMKLINDIGCRKVKVPPTVKGNLPKNKSLKKINIPIDEQIYKGLIDLDVREEDLGLNVVQIKPKEFNKQKDPEPVLSDYYKPKFNREYIVKPCPPEFELSKIWNYKGNRVLNVINKWES